MVEEHQVGGATGVTMMNGDIQPRKDQQDDETGFRHKVERLLLCYVCHDTVTDPRQLNCGHFHCFQCVQLLTADDIVRCAKCTADTAVPAEGIRVDELAAELLVLLDEFRPQARKAVNGKSLTVTPAVNGIEKYMDEDDASSSDDEVTATNDTEKVAAQVFTTPAADAEPTSDVNATTVFSATPAIEAHVAAPVVLTDDIPADVAATQAVNLDEVHAPGVEDEHFSADPVGIPEVILEPPEDYQSPDEENHDEPLPPPPITAANEAAKTPVEHDATETEEIKKTQEAAEEVREEPAANDETDSLMKPSEMKPSEVASISLEIERQCGDCHSAKCTCNVSLLTPPASNGSQLSVETTTSNNPSEDGDAEISVKHIAKFSVNESASHVEVANRNRVYVTRWTYDENGAVCTFDISGNKVKFVHSGHHSFGGITISKLGFVFALNTSKHRLEEYSSVDGKKVKQFKLELCRDPQAVDIMPTGEILVVDQEKNRVIVYPNSKKGASKPKLLKNELIKDPHDIASCPEGFYITCSGTRSLLKMDLDGNIIWKYCGQASETSKQLKVLQGVCTDESGNVYVVDRDNDAILVFTEDGEIKGRIKVRERAHKNQRPWYVSVRDGVMAVLFSHNLVKTFQLQ